MDSFQLSPEAKRAIFENSFNYKVTSQQAETIGRTYFYYYQDSMKSCGLDGSSSCHQKIASVVALLKRPDTTRATLEMFVKKQLSSNSDDSVEILYDSINLAVRLLLMIPIGPFLGSGITLRNETYLSWREGTITELVSTTFSPQTQIQERVKLEKVFNARNLKRIAGMEIRWTSNLADHLRMRDEDTAVELFHCASFLKFHQDWYGHKIVSSK
jgi:hypothetical protein